METYVAKNLFTIQAEKINQDTVVRTSLGEFLINAGDYLVSILGGSPQPMSRYIFENYFKKFEAIDADCIKDHVVSNCTALAPISFSGYNFTNIKQKEGD